MATQTKIAYRTRKRRTGWYVEIDGLEEALAALTAIPEIANGPEVKIALMQGLKIVQQEIVSRLRSYFSDTWERHEVEAARRKPSWIEPDSLMNSVQAFTFQSKAGPAGIVKVMLDEGGAHAYWIEYGTEDTPAKPYFRPGVRATQGKAAKALIEAVTDLYSEYLA